VKFLILFELENDGAATQVVEIENRSEAPPKVAAKALYDHIRRHSQYGKWLTVIPLPEYL
jgi:hypothetical protein